MYSFDTAASRKVGKTCKTRVLAVLSNVIVIIELFSKSRAFNQQVIFPRGARCSPLRCRHSHGVNPLLAAVPGFTTGCICAHGLTQEKPWVKTLSPEPLENPALTETDCWAVLRHRRAAKPKSQAQAELTDKCRLLLKIKERFIRIFIIKCWLKASLNPSLSAGIRKTVQPP